MLIVIIITAMAAITIGRVAAEIDAHHGADIGGGTAAPLCLLLGF